MWANELSEYGSRAEPTNTLGQMCLYNHKEYHKFIIEEHQSCINEKWNYLRFCSGLGWWSGLELCIECMEKSQIEKGWYTCHLNVFIF